MRIALFITCVNDTQGAERFAGDVALEASADFGCGLAFGVAPFDVLAGAWAGDHAAVGDGVHGSVERGRRRG
ncbi:hypothetical protein ACVCAH_33300 [Micromonospora sp. LZ34]